ELRCNHRVGALPPNTNASKRQPGRARSPRRAANCQDRPSHRRRAEDCVSRLAPSCRFETVIPFLPKGGALRSFRTFRAYMKRTALVAMLVFSLLPGPGLPACRAGQTNEESLIKILQSPAASPRAKGEACAQLKLMGTARSVQALAPLLLDEQLSHSARYALESMPDPAAGKALLRALTRTSGLMQEGIINSLTVRGEPAAVPQLAILLSKPDEGAAIAAAGAMGRIGGRKALASLQTAALKSTNSLHYAVVDGILMCANRMLDAGKPAAALKAFESLYSCEKADRIRLAAFR